MKYSTAGVIILVLVQIAFLAGFPSAAGASWLIDAGKYHVSAHGQTSCRDCHQDIADKALHPDPSDVGKIRTDFFSPEMCFFCHDDIQDELKAGKHGRKEIQDPGKYTHCLRCHKPHRQPRLGGDRIGKFIPGIPRERQCGACHAIRADLPPFSKEDEACMACHRAVNPKSAEGRRKIQTFCFHCHEEGDTPAKKATGALVPLMNAEAYRNTPHADQSCTACHPGGAAFQHQDQPRGDCLQCHTRHDEKKAHDAHLEVSCEACHLKGVTPFRDPVSKRVLWKLPPDTGRPLQIHDMVSGRGQDTCTRCHEKGNKVGAPAMVLPAKSVICMPCHAATFSVGDTTTIIALVIFLAGILLLLSYWLTGTFSAKDADGPVPKTRKSLFAGVFHMPRTLLLDVLLQRRLYRQSEGRWLIHALIFYPFLFRFTWGMVGLLGSLWRPASGTVWLLLDKNNYLTALLFDISGILILLGVLVALARGTLNRLRRLPGLPGQDPLALGLIGGIVIVGFVLEGMRMAMTGLPGDAGYAVVGYWISRLFSDPSGLTSLYGYVWYAHAILAAGFVAYLPFSRLLHIILAPVVLLMDAATGHDRGDGKETP
jgi:nitrate reductase gamma subunit